MLIVAISCVNGFLDLRTQKSRLVETMVMGADQLSHSIASATWHAMLDDRRESAYEIMQVIADKQGVDRIRMFNREGKLMFSTDPRERPSVLLVHDEVCTSCHDRSTPRQSPPSAPRVRYATPPEGIRTVNIVTPIFDEPSCANTACHAHPRKIKVLGVLDVALRLDPVDQQQRAITWHKVVWTLVVVTIGAAFVILFTRRFVAKPVGELIEATKAVSA